jgi:3-phenylpropionate/trans-cinnamate dioxygenase ferredoxin subunit
MSKSRATRKVRVCPLVELPPGERKIIDVDGRSIGVFHLEYAEGKTGPPRLHALKNICPHQMAPLCVGKVSGTTLPSLPGELNYGREGEIIRCPWHGWEFDLTTGQSVFNPHRCRVKHYDVATESGGTQTIDSDDPDPAVETFQVQTEGEDDEEWVVLLV